MWGWWVGLAASAAVLLLAGLNLLSLAAAADWRLDLLTHFRFQYTLAFGAATLVLVLFRWRKMAVVALLGLGLNIGFVAPFYLPRHDARGGQALPADDAAPALSLLHYNVNTANPRRADVVRLIRESGADVVFVQEISPAWTPALAGLAGVYEPVELALRADNFGIGLWVRADRGVQVVSAVSRDISEGVAQVPAIDAVLRVEGREVRVLSLHTLPPISGRYARARDAQLAAAASIASAAEGPFILIGDLNVTPWSSAYRGLVHRGGLTDSLRGRGGLGWGAPGASWHAKLGGLGMIPIDHCLTRGGVVVVGRGLGEATGSDHRPLYVETRLSP